MPIWDKPQPPTSGSPSRWLREGFELLQANIESFIQGKPEVVRLALICILSEGHLLIDDVPGTGKTSLAKALARSIGGTSSRVQFTPDLLPSDITGSQIWRPDEKEFEFRPGPVFANVVVGDEINRASPKTQSALLEVMEERQVTVDRKRYHPPRPFLVIATQNPVEYEGTYHLPEAQIDRFMMRIAMGYPDEEDEVKVLRLRTGGADVDQVERVMDAATLAAMIAAARQVHIADAVHRYAVKLCAETRRAKGVRLGVSPRGSLALVTAAQSLAASAGREFVSTDDIKQMAPHILHHRILLEAAVDHNGRSPAQVLGQIMAQLPVPSMAA